MKTFQITFFLILTVLSVFLISCKNEPTGPIPPSIAPGEIFFPRFRYIPVISHAVYSISSDGTNKKLVTTFGIIISPPFQNKMLLGRGDSIYFINNMYVANLDGTGIIEIPRSTYYPVNAKLSPDAMKVLFTCDVGNYLVVVNADGTGLIQLSENIRGTEQAPAFSPDSKQIAFIETEPNFDSYITLINVDGTNPVRIKDSIHYSSESMICWSPDGSKLAFDNVDKNGKTSIFTINKDGSGYFNLTASTHGDFFPDWSPDGSKILYSEFGQTGIPDIAVVNSDGTGKRKLTNTANLYERNPKWSPNGTKALFSSQDMSMQTSLKVIDISSGNVTNIADSTSLGFWNFSK
jgi:Tol biopolymer transport system component